MLLRVAAAGALAVSLAMSLAVSLALGNTALAREPAKEKAPPAASKPAARTPPPAAARSPAKPSFESREPAGGATPGKQRQKACIAEWRALSGAEKTAKGPGWPQFYSKCVKRLKGAQKE